MDIQVEKAISKFTPAKLMPYISLSLSNPVGLANAIDKNKISWPIVLKLYFLFLTVGIIVLNSVTKFHSLPDTTYLSMAFYYTMMLPVSAWLMQLPFVFSNNKASFNKNLKATYITFGILFLFNSALLPFHINLWLGGKWYITLVPALLVLFWTIRAWSTFTTLNKIYNIYYKATAFVITVFLVAVAPIFTSVLVKYFVRNG